LAYSAFVGSFNIDVSKTAGQTQAITGVGFTPKIVLFWWSGTVRTGDGVAGETIRPGFGAVAGASSRFFVAAYSEDAAARTNTAHGASTTACIGVYADGTPTADGLADWGSFDADGFTLTIDDQFTIAARISYLALGGTDLSNVFIGNKAYPTSAGNYATTGVGFQPDAMIFVPTNLGSAATSAVSLHFGIGIAAGGAQGATYNNDGDDGATSNTTAYGYNGEVIATRIMGIRESWVSFDADGFTLNHLEGATANYYHYVALKGGQYKVGELTTRTDGNDIVETEPNFTPVGLLFLSANRAHSTQDTPTDHARLSIGAATSASNRAAQAISDEDNLADTETATANYDTAVYANVLDDGVVGLMDIKSIDATGFTAVMDDTDPSACWVTYLAIGGAAVSSYVPRHGFIHHNNPAVA